MKAIILVVISLLSGMSAFGINVKFALNNISNFKANVNKDINTHHYYGRRSSGGTNKNDSSKSVYGYSNKESKLKISLIPRISKVKHHVRRYCIEELKVVADGRHKLDCRPPKHPYHKLMIGRHVWYCSWHGMSLLEFELDPLPPNVKTLSINGKLGVCVGKTKKLDFKLKELSKHRKTLKKTGISIKVGWKLETNWGKWLMKPKEVFKAHKVVTVKYKFPAVAQFHLFLRRGTTHHLVSKDNTKNKGDLLTVVYKKIPWDTTDYEFSIEYLKDWKKLTVPIQFNNISL